MLKRFGSKSDFGASTEGSYSQAIQAIDALYQREMQANMAALSEQRRRMRLHRSAMDFTEYWPLALGVVIACFAPQVHDFVAAVQPWGMWIVFPFASIATRPEITSSAATSTLPMILMYAQFPVEGLLARFALRGQVTVPRVLGQVLFLHLLAVIQLWLVNGPWGK